MVGLAAKAAFSRDAAAVARGHREYALKKPVANIDHQGMPDTVDPVARRLMVMVAGLCGLAEAALMLAAPRPGVAVPACMGLVAALGGVAAWAVRRGARHHAALIRVEQDAAEQARARSAAETANMAKSRYLANVSHEIRSPLNAIYGYAQLVERNDGAGAQEAAVVIRRCAEHITSLVEALLDISQVENGVIRVKLEPVRFDQFLDQIARMVRPAAKDKGLDFHFETRGRIPATVRMDQSRLRQVLLNLLFNAIKYTPGGSVTLAVVYSAQIATFEVRDTGPGIGAEDQKAIFEPYQRGGDDATLAQPGMGLGLSIARAIVDILGGKLEIASSGPLGTCFRLTMMLGEVSAPYAKARPRREVSGYLGERRRILLCDDDAEQRRFLGELLGSLGFVVEAAANGETAVELVEGGHRYDLAILDISMPGITGWETAARLRDRLGDDIRILMLSANAHEFYRPETRQAVHDHFLIKPVQFEQLIETIGGLLDLAWAVEAEAAVDAAPAKNSDAPENSDRPGHDPVLSPHTSRIRELLRIGYVRGIEQEIRQLADQPATAELADQLYACLDRFDLPAMSRLVEEC